MPVPIEKRGFSNTSPGSPGLSRFLNYPVPLQWILYREHMGKGYTKSITIPITRSDGNLDTKLHTQWSQKGRLLIHQILTARGIVAVMDRVNAS